MHRLAFPNAAELSRAIDELFAEFPVVLYYGLDTVAPFPDFQSHDGHEFYYVWKGRGAYIAGDDVYAIGPGTLMPIRPRLMHKVLQTDIDQPVCRHVLLIRDDFFRRESLNKIFPAHGDPGHAPGRPLFVPEAGRETIDRLYHDLHVELAAKEAGYEHAVSGYLKLLLTRLRRYGECGSAGSPAQQPSAHLPREVVYMIQHVSSNFQSALELNDIAKKIHMNPSYASQLFHRHTGHTLRQFITLKRMHHARNLLRDTALPVHAVARESGYKDPSHFIRVFKQTCGHTPESYRRDTSAK